ncbi:hypothetical protein ACQUQP_11855 [Marinobacterium sp. YM272]|uniref:hypothetical protein n=1 Tax=Marinobacterium sp. YM272 TaxID=3421654 RepID=UPI003D7F208A
MKFEKADKGFVIWWIDRQFANVPDFPTSCCAKSDGGGKGSVSRQHVLAYKAWRKVSTKRRTIQEWIDTWLDDTEQEQLLKAIKQNDHYKKLNL